MGVDTSSNSVAPLQYSVVEVISTCMAAYTDISYKTITLIICHEYTCYP